MDSVLLLRVTFKEAAVLLPITVIATAPTTVLLYLTTIVAEPSLTGYRYPLVETISTEESEDSNVKAVESVASLVTVVPSRVKWN